MSLTPEELSQKIKEAQNRHEPEIVAQKPESRKNNAAIKAGTDFFAALVVGVVLGYWIDRWLHTKPFGIIIFLFLGFAAGFLNLYRSQTRGNDQGNDQANDKDKG